MKSPSVFLFEAWQSHAWVSRLVDRSHHRQRSDRDMQTCRQALFSLPRRLWNGDSLGLEAARGSILMTGVIGALRSDRVRPEQSFRKAVMALHPGRRCGNQLRLGRA